MRNVALTGILAASGLTITALLASGGGGAAIAWIVALCLPEGQSMVASDIPHLTIEHSRHFGVGEAVGLGVISAAFVLGGLWPVKAAMEAGPVIDGERVLAAMVRTARATGGVSETELAALYTEVTGLPMDPNDMVIAARRRDGEPIDWIAAATLPSDREAILTGALRVGWSHGAFTPEALEFLGQLANALGLDGDALAERFDRLTAPSERQEVAAGSPDPFDRLRRERHVALPV